MLVKCMKCLLLNLYKPRILFPVVQENQGRWRKYESRMGEVRGRDNVDNMDAKASELVEKICPLLLDEDLAMCL